MSESILCSYAAYLADQGLAPQSIRVYLSAVRSMQISLGLPNPRDQSSLPILQRVQAGIRRAHAAKESNPPTRLPITAHVLRQLKAVWEQSSHPDRTTLWAVACTAFYGFFRLGELLLTSPSSFHQQRSLAWGDVAVDDTADPTVIRIHLKHSKCDQFGAGANVVLGKSGTDICPVAALVEYISARGDSPGPFFLSYTRKPLLKADFVTETRRALARAGFHPHNYAGHSFRIGAATSAAQAGIEDSTIRTLGRWHSAAFLQYIRSPESHLATFSARLASTAPEPSIRDGGET